MAQTAPTRTSTGCLGAGGPVWYAVLTVSFLSCSLNPVGAAGLAMRILTPHDMYSKPVGWLLTAGSFFIAMTGFIATERIAYLERQRRPLEIASLLACGSALLAFALGFTLPMYIMWPIAAVLVLIGASGFRGTKSLPIPGLPATDARGLPASPPRRSDGGRSAGDSSITPTPRRRRRRRRRRKNRPPPSTPPANP
jgi:hypothetical protein